MWVDLLPTSHEGDYSIFLVITLSVSFKDTLTHNHDDSNITHNIQPYFYKKLKHVIFNNYFHFPHTFIIFLASLKIKSN